VDELQLHVRATEPLNREVARLRAELGTAAREIDALGELASRSAELQIQAMDELCRLRSQNEELQELCRSMGSCPECGGRWAC